MEIEYKKETNYIRRRKIKAFRESLLYYIFRIFPIKKNRITVTTYEGKGGFCCNPKYIVKELHKRDTELEFIWLVNDPESKEFPDYIRKEKNDIWHRAYYLTTSKVWIDNYRKPLGTKKRKGQFYVNTWHGNLGFKRIGLWRGKAFSKIAYLVSKNDSDMIDVYLFKNNILARFVTKMLDHNIDEQRSRDDINNQLLKLEEAVCAMYGPKDSDEVAVTFLQLNRDRRFPVKAFTNIIMQPFEFTEIPVPLGYHEILTAYYEDYMVKIKSPSYHEYPFYKQQKALLEQAGIFIDYDHMEIR